MPKKQRHRKTRRPQSVPVMQRRLFVFYENSGCAGVFQEMLSLSIDRYRGLAERTLPELRLELRSVTMDELKTICEEERCDDLEMIVQCHFLEIYKVCPEDLVVAIGEKAQKTLWTLKARAETWPDHGARFFTMAEALMSASLPIAPGSDKAYALYLEKIAERLYAE